jgi:hypothetical protein
VADDHLGRIDLRLVLDRPAVARAGDVHETILLSTNNLLNQIQCCKHKL